MPLDAPRTRRTSAPSKAHSTRPRSKERRCLGCSPRSPRARPLPSAGENRNVDSTTLGSPRRGGKRWMISRRALLSGAGVAMGLPFLEQMMPVARGASTAPPLRFLAFYCPSGMIADAWKPTGTGTTYTFNRTMQPLAPLKDDLLVISGVGKQGGCFKGATGHDVGTGGMLTGGYGTVSDGRLDPGTVTVDQLIAGVIGKDTKLHSVQTQVFDTHAFSRLHEHISWTGDNSPLANEQDPKALFDRLFAGYAPTNDATALAAA